MVGGGGSGIIKSSITIIDIIIIINIIRQYNNNDLGNGLARSCNKRLLEPLLNQFTRTPMHSCHEASVS